ncbi:hypothetical protein AAY473_008260 [Plecturocebus cupreus]
MFDLNTRGPDDEHFTSHTRNIVLGSAPTSAFGSLAAVFIPYVQRCIRKVTIATAALGEAEGCQWNKGVTLELAEVPGLGGTPDDWRPHEELVIHWFPTSVQHVLALVDIGAECSLVYENMDKFPGKPAYIDDYGGQSVKGSPYSIILMILATPLLQQHLAACGWAINKYKVQRLGLSARFLRVNRSDEADALAKVPWLKSIPTRDVALWLYQKLGHAGVPEGRGRENLAVATDHLSPHCWWLAIVAPWGKDLQYELHVTPWVFNTWPL